MRHRAAALVAPRGAAVLAPPAPAGAQAGSSYLIPPDNPFVGQAGAAPEVWAYGLRNPYRFSFDRAERHAGDRRRGAPAAAGGGGRARPGQAA